MQVCGLLGMWGVWGLEYEVWGTWDVGYVGVWECKFVGCGCRGVWVCVIMGVRVCVWRHGEWAYDPHYPEQPLILPTADPCCPMSPAWDEGGRVNPCSWPALSLPGKPELPRLPAHRLSLLYPRARHEFFIKGL